VLIPEEKEESLLISAGGLLYAMSLLEAQKENPPTARNILLFDVVLQKLRAGHSRDRSTLDKIYGYTIEWKDAGLCKKAASLYIDQSGDSTINKLLPAMREFGFEALKQM